MPKSLGIKKKKNAHKYGNATKKENATTKKTDVIVMLVLQDLCVQWTYQVSSKCY